MKILDKYIIRKFLGTFFFTMSLIILVVVVIDLAEKVDDFIEKKAPFTAIIFDYYLNFIPYYISLLSPLFIFIAVIYFSSNMASRSEIVAILGSGISYKRFLYPYFIGALIVCVINYLFTSFVVPACHKKVLAFEQVYIKNKQQVVNTNIYLQKAPGLFVTLESFNQEDSVGYNFCMDFFVGTNKVFRLSADRISWNSKKQNWSLENYLYRLFTQSGQEMLQAGSRKDTTLLLKPDEFVIKNTTVSTLDYFELRDAIKEMKSKGSESLDSFYVEQYKRGASSFAMFVLTLLGVGISARKARGGIGIHLGLGLFISFTFLLMTQFSLTFGISGQVHPLLAVWIPNIAYSILGIYIAIKAPK